VTHGTDTLTVPESFVVQLHSESRQQEATNDVLVAAMARCAKSSLVRLVHTTRGSDQEPEGDDDDNDNKLSRVHEVHAPNQHTAPLVLNQLVVQVLQNSAPYKTISTDESYSIKVVAPSATLKANTVWGALYGLETFSQLVRYNAASGAHEIVNASLTIQDEPRFPWRGLLVDTVNHFLPLELLMRTVEALAQNKMNVLHLHSTDSYSFPVQFKALPLLSAKGAWHQDAIYTLDDLKALVEHGRMYGVRVVSLCTIPSFHTAPYPPSSRLSCCTYCQVFELDMPGHAYAWGLGYPELVVNDCPAALRQVLLLLVLIPH
jgi:hypothetical protein